MANKMLAPLDDRTADDIAGYYASLARARPAQISAAGSEPQLVVNKMLASLDDRTMDDIAGYFAGLIPTRTGQPGGGSAGPAPASRSWFATAWSPRSTSKR
jgi:cytochrome c553